MAITQLTKIVNGSLTPSNEKLAGSLVELSAGAGNALKAEADGLMVDLSTYATEGSVDAKIAEAQLAGGEVDLSAYATNDSVDTKIAAIPAVDVSGKVDKVAGKGLSTEDFTTVHKTAVEGIDANINSKVNTAIASVVNGAPAAFDTLKEISDWIEGDGVNATELAASVATKADKTATDALDTRIEALETAPGVDLSGYATQDDLGRKLDIPETIQKESSNPTLVNSLPLYTLDNEGTFVLCTPDIWINLDGFFVPGYAAETLSITQ